VACNDVMAQVQSTKHGSNLAFGMLCSFAASTP
jgi:hypothetical protein